jgi:hypothetical protein
MRTGRLDSVPWKRNKGFVEAGLSDLKWVPRQRCGWDMSLASLAYQARCRIERRPADLAAWAARHSVAASQRYIDLAENALVLWHGTSQPRAMKIAEHGLFHRRGLWTITDPDISHGYCRGRSDRFGADGAVVCLVLDRRTIVEGRDYEIEAPGTIYRFHRGMPPESLEYILLPEETRFFGAARARQPRPWTRGEFKRQDGQWIPVQNPPVRFEDGQSYRTLGEYPDLCMRRLLDEFGTLAAIEVFSMLYANLSPWDALEHQAVLDLMARHCAPPRAMRGRTIVQPATAGSRN